MASVMSATRPWPGRAGDHGVQGGVHVVAVQDHLDGDPRVLEQRDHRTGLPVVHGTHRIEQVRARGGAGTDRGAHDVVGRVGVTDRRDRTRVDHGADRVERAGPFRSDGDHPDRAAGDAQDGRHLGRIGITEQPDVVGPAASLGQPRALEVDAGQLTGGDPVGQRAHVGEQPVRGRGDQRGDQRGGAVPPVERERGAHLAGVGAGERPPAAAVRVHVDESRHQGGVGAQVGDRSAVGRRTAARAADRRPVDGDPAGAQHRVAGHHCPCAQHRARRRRHGQNRSEPGQEATAPSTGAPPQVG